MHLLSFSQKNGLGQGQTKNKKEEAYGTFAIGTHCYRFNDLPMFVLLWSRCEVPPNNTKKMIIQNCKK
jgi:hypothetical protein